MADHRELVLGRQEPLRRSYRSSPDGAWITDRAETVGGVMTDPFHGLVLAGERQDEGWRVGIHRAVGGFHDRPNPGDILCAALASCLDTTLRMIAARLRLPVETLSVVVTGEVDVRGTLAVDPEVPVGFQRMSCRIEIEAGDEAPPGALEWLVAAAERACVVLRTLREGVPVALEVARPDVVAAEGPSARPSLTQGG